MTSNEAALQARIAQLEAMLDKMSEGIDNLRTFVTTADKFKGDGNMWISTTDVDYRLRDIRANVADVEMEPWGAFSKVRLHKSYDGTGYWIERHPDNSYSFRVDGDWYSVWKGEVK